MTSLDAIVYGRHGDNHLDERRRDLVVAFNGEFTSNYAAVHHFQTVDPVFGKVRNNGAVFLGLKESTLVRVVDVENGGTEKVEYTVAAGERLFLPPDHNFDYTIEPQEEAVLLEARMLTASQMNQIYRSVVVDERIIQEDIITTVQPKRRGLMVGSLNKTHFIQMGFSAQQVKALLMVDDLPEEGIQLGGHYHGYREVYWAKNNILWELIDPRTETETRHHHQKPLELLDVRSGTAHRATVTEPGAILIGLTELPYADASKNDVPFTDF